MAETEAGTVVDIVRRYDADAGVLIPMMQDMQAEHGYLPQAELKELSGRLGVPLAQIYSVATFYASFRLMPKGEREDLVRWSLWSRDQKGEPQAVVSHDTALTVHNLSDVMPARVHLTVPKGFRKRVVPGCVLHRANLDPESIEPRTGYRVTTPLRTLLDVAESPLSQEHLDAAVRDALERGLVRRQVLQGEQGSPEARRRLDQALAAAQREEPIG